MILQVTLHPSLSGSCAIPFGSAPAWTKNRTTFLKSSESFVCGFRVWGLGFRVPKSSESFVCGFRVWGLGFRVPKSSESFVCGFRVWGLGFRVPKSSESLVWGLLCSFLLRRCRVILPLEVSSTGRKTIAT